MKNRWGWIIIGFIGLAIVAPTAWYLASPLFINRVVEEEFPAQNAAVAELPRPESQAAAAAEVAAGSEELLKETRPEGAPAEPRLLLQGQFKDGDSFHKGSGQAAIYQLADGSSILRFEDFSATNGPDLHVILSAHPAPTTSEEVMQGYLDLGSLKGNIGSQNYVLPAGTDVSRFKSVIIYCQPFHVIFATASLSSQ